MNSPPRPEHPPDKAGAFLAVAIPTLDRPGAVVLANRLSTEAAALEGVTVSIFNNGASRSIAENARKLPHVAFHHDDAPGLSRARNKALRSCDAAYVLFLDDDIIPPDGFLSRIVATLKDHAPDILGAPIDPAFDGEAPPWLPAEYVTRRKSEQSGWRPTGSVSGGNFAVRRSTALAIGGFREDLGMVGDRMAFLEELEFVLRYRASPARHGAGIYYALDCAVAHPMAPSSTRLGYLVRRAWLSHAAKGRLFAALAGTRRCAAYRLAAIGAFAAGGAGRLLTFPATAMRDGLQKAFARLCLESAGAAGLAFGALSAPAGPGTPALPDMALLEGGDFTGEAGSEFDPWAYAAIRFVRRPGLRTLARLVIEAPATAIEVEHRSPGDLLFEALGFIRRRNPRHDGQAQLPGD